MGQIENKIFCLQESCKNRYIDWIVVGLKRICFVYRKIVDGEYWGKGIVVL